MKASPAMVEMRPGWQALGYSTTNVERASGQHAKDLLVIVEEASGVEGEIWDALESLKYSKLVAIGNPIRAEGRFVDLIRQADTDRADGIEPRKAVCAIRIPSTESPHADLGGVALWTRRPNLARSLLPALRPGQLVGPLAHPGRGARGQFDVLIPPEWLDRATAVQRPSLPPGHPVNRSRRIAVDLGEGVGRDSTAILVRDDDGILDCVAGNSLPLASAAQESRASAASTAFPPSEPATTSSGSAGTSETTSSSTGSETPSVTPAAADPKTARRSSTSAPRRHGSFTGG